MGKEGCKGERKEDSEVASAGSVGVNLYEGASADVRTCRGQGVVKGGSVLKGGLRGFVVVFAEQHTEAIAAFGAFGDADVADVAVVAVVVATFAILNHCGCLD